MRMRDLVREALRALEANRGRSFLTILGIVIGIAAVIAMTSFIGGVQEGLVGQLGLNAARIARIRYSSGVTESDIKRLKLALPEYEAIEGSMDSYTELKKDDKTLNISISGGSPTYFEMTGQAAVLSGRMFTAAEDEAASRVVLLDQNGVNQLFGSPDFDAVGKTVKLKGRDYTVLGIYQGTQMSMGSGTYLQVLMPLQTVKRDFANGGNRIFDLTGLAREGVDINELAKRTTEKIATMKRVPEDEVESSVWVFTMKQAIDQMNQFMGSFSLIISSVAGISLLVGGIGIMNMMLTNVTERIREIGVRRALGATRRDITLQFLAESAVICVAGGIIGTVFGYIISGGLALGASSLGISQGFGGGENFSISPAINVETILLAVGISMAIGLLFGFYPARRAARLDPVECLRYQ